VSALPSPALPVLAVPSERERWANVAHANDTAADACAARLAGLHAELRAASPTRAARLRDRIAIEERNQKDHLENAAEARRRMEAL
jgi:hypothetical protein